jgi:hypothetical protein
VEEADGEAEEGAQLYGDARNLEPPLSPDADQVRTFAAKAPVLLTFSGVTAYRRVV